MNRNLSYFVFIMAICAFMSISCQEEVQLNSDMLPVSIKDNPSLEGEVARFNFSNGNILIIVAEKDGTDIGISTLEYGTSNNTTFFDFEKYSTLDLFLKLTPDGSPVPEVLLTRITPEKRQEVLSSRPLVDRLQNTIDLKIGDLNEKLFRPSNNVANARFDPCDAVPDYIECRSNMVGPYHQWTTPEIVEKLFSYTIVHEDSYDELRLEHWRYKSGINGWSWSRTHDWLLKRGESLTVTTDWGPTIMRVVRKSNPDGGSVSWTGLMFGYSD